MRRIKRPDRLYLAGALLILLFIGLLSLQDWKAFGTTSADVEQTRQILQHTEVLLSALKDAETGQRGFVITGDDQYLDPYTAALSSVPAEISQLRALSSSRPGVRTRIDALEVLIREKLEELKETIQARREAGFPAAQQLINTNRGKRTMDEVRRLGSEIQNDVYTNLAMESRQWQQEGQRTQLTMALGGVILFCFLLLATFDIGRATAERDRLIVELQLANSRALANRDLLQTTLSSIGDAVIATDSAANITFLNPIAAALTGWKQEEAAGQPLDRVFNIINENTRGTVESPAAKVLRDGNVVGLANHTVLITRDGTERPIDDSGAPIRDGQGAIVGVVLVFRDIAERRATETALKESEERLRLAIEAGEIGIWDLDVRANRITWSERLYRLHGIEPGAFEGKLEDFAMLIHPDDRERMQISIQRLLHDRTHHRLEFRVVHPDGSVHWLTTSALAHYDEQGNAIRMLGAVTDMSERKTTEQQLLALNENLQRTNQDLQQFSYAASHDLKEPLRTVSNYLQLLRNRYKGQVLGPEAMELVQIATAGAQRMHALVEALLEYSRAGEVGESNLEPVAVEQAVDDALSVLQASIRETGAEICVNPLPTLKANRLHLAQVFQNLIGNALKYRSDKAPVVTVSAKNHAAEWQFSVADNGIGIQPHQHSQIFGIFKRLHGSEYPGAGIGLATCKKIVERYGGRIWVESEAGKGCTFCFTLPKGL